MRKIEFISPETWAKLQQEFEYVEMESHYDYSLHRIVYDFAVYCNTHHIIGFETVLDSDIDFIYALLAILGLHRDPDYPTHWIR